MANVNVSISKEARRSQRRVDDMNDVVVIFDKTSSVYGPHPREWFYVICNQLEWRSHSRYGVPLTDPEESVTSFKTLDEAARDARRLGSYNFAYVARTRLPSGFREVDPSLKCMPTEEPKAGRQFIRVRRNDEGYVEVRCGVETKGADGKPVYHLGRVTHLHCKKGADEHEVDFGDPVDEARSSG